MKKFAILVTFLITLFYHENILGQCVEMGPWVLTDGKTIQLISFDQDLKSDRLECTASIEVKSPKGGKICSRDLKNTFYRNGTTKTECFTASTQLPMNCGNVLFKYSCTVIVESVCGYQSCPVSESF